MIQNFHLLSPRTEVPVTQVQFLPRFLHPHEVVAINAMIAQLPFYQGDILGNNENSNIVFRDSSIKWIEWNDDNWWLYSKIMEKVKDLNDKIWQFELFGINEYLQYTEYAAKPSGRGHYDYHMDLGHHGLTSNRKISFEIILDDNYQGGDFSLLMGPTEQKVRLSKGDAVFYPSFLMNKVYPVRSGKRTSLVGWTSGPAFR